MRLNGRCDDFELLSNVEPGFHVDRLPAFAQVEHNYIWTWVRCMTKSKQFELISQQLGYFIRLHTVCTRRHRRWVQPVSRCHWRTTRHVESVPSACRHLSDSLGLFFPPPRWSICNWRSQPRFATRCETSVRRTIPMEWGARWITWVCVVNVLVCVACLWIDGIFPRDDCICHSNLFTLPIVGSKKQLRK